MACREAGDMIPLFHQVLPGSTRFSRVLRGSFCEALADRVRCRVSLPRIGIQEREYVRLPGGNTVVWEVMTIVGGLANRRIDLQAVRFPETCEFGIEGFARISRVVVCRMNEEERNGCVPDRFKQARAEFRRSVPAVPSAGEDNGGAH